MKPIIMYPEHKKYQKWTQDQIDAINEFCEVLKERGYSLTQQTSSSLFDNVSFEEAKYNFFSIDSKKLETERKHMLNKQKEV